MSKKEEIMIMAIESWAGALINSDKVKAEYNRQGDMSVVHIFCDGERVFSDAWFSIDIFDAMIDLILAHMLQVTGSIDDKESVVVDGWDIKAIMPDIFKDLGEYTKGISAVFKTKRGNPSHRTEALKSGFRLLRRTILTMRKELNDG